MDGVPSLHQLDGLLHPCGRRHRRQQTGEKNGHHQSSHHDPPSFIKNKNSTTSTVSFLPACRTEERYNYRIFAKVISISPLRVNNREKNIIGRAHLHFPTMRFESRNNQNNF
jgi:hypothetical protein